MMIFAFRYLMVVLVSLAQASESIYADERHELERDLTSDVYVFLCDCWGIGATWSEVAFFSESPPRDGNAQPDFHPIIRYSSNYDFEDGGSVQERDGSNFNWTISASAINLLANQKAGNATDDSHKFIVYKGTGQVLYQDWTNNVQTNCTVAYSAQPLDANSTDGLVTPGSGSRPPSVQSAPNGTQAGLSLQAQLIIGVGTSMTVVLLLTVGLLVWRHVRQRRLSNVAKVKPIELDTGAERSAISRSTTIGISSEPVSAILELHPDYMMEMDGTDRQFIHERLPPYPLPFSPSESYAEKKHFELQRH